MLHCEVVFGRFESKKRNQRMFFSRSKSRLRRNHGNRRRSQKAGGTVANFHKKSGSVAAQQYRVCVRHRYAENGGERAQKCDPVGGTAIRSAAARRGNAVLDRA